MRIADILLSMAKWLKSPENEALLLAEYREDCLEKVATSCVAAATILEKCANEVDVMEDKRHLLVEEAKQLLNALAVTSLDQNILTVSLFDGEEKLGEVTDTPHFAAKQLEGLELPTDITATIALATDEQVIDGETMEKMSTLAGVLDASTDTSLHKQASVIDELLLTIAAPEGWADNFKAAQAKKMDELKKLYQEPNEVLHKEIGVDAAKKAIEKSEYNKDLRPLETELSTRYCPDHPGALIARVGNNIWQCNLDKKVYNVEEGYTDDRGRKHPPGGAPAVAEMTKRNPLFHSIFDSRQERLDKMH